MGLFRKLGRQVEQFKEEAKTAAENHVANECKECGARFSDQHDQCPECKCGDVISVEQQA